MTRIFGLLLSTLILLGLLAPKAQAAGLPIVTSATVDYTHMTLTITGQNFGSNPVVTLDKLSFPTVSTSTNQIVANIPSGSPPTTLTPGTYFLTLQYRNQFPSIFTVDIGANGPQGIQGAAGPSGPTGPIPYRRDATAPAPLDEKPWPSAHRLPRLRIGSAEIHAPENRRCPPWSACG